jgi:serine/threonine-protein kinase
MQFEPGMLITSSIQLRELLAEGGMGQVWAAEHLLLHRPVAIKRLASQLADNTEALQRFAAEAQAGARMESANVTRVFDYALLADGTPFLVMELLKGVELYSRIRDGRVVTLEETSQIVAQICAALSAIHDLGIVHRDVKPENIFLVPNKAGGFTAKLIDFGIAKVGGTGQGEKPAKTGAAILGTPAYMSPEQLEDAGQVDGRADLWSLAVVAYACLTGTMPFLGDSLAALRPVIRRGTFVHVTRRRPDLPSGIDAWFARALSVERDARFLTAREMADDFGRAVRREVVPITGLSPTRVARKPPKRLELVYHPTKKTSFPGDRARAAALRLRRPSALRVLTAIAAVTGAAAAAPPGMTSFGGPSGSAHRAVASAVHGTTHGMWAALPTFIQDAVALLRSEAARAVRVPTKKQPVVRPPSNTTAKGDDSGAVLR